VSLTKEVSRLKLSVLNLFARFLADARWWCGSIRRSGVFDIREGGGNFERFNRVVSGENAESCFKGYKGNGENFDCGDASRVFEIDRDGRSEDIEDFFMEEVRVSEYENDCLLNGLISEVVEEQKDCFEA